MVKSGLLDCACLNDIPSSIRIDEAEPDKLASGPDGLTFTLCVRGPTILESPLRCGAKTIVTGNSRCPVVQLGRANNAHGSAVEPGLVFEHHGVTAAPTRQFLVGSLLDDAPVLQHDDAVHEPRQREAMAHH